MELERAGHCNPNEARQMWYACSLWRACGLVSICCNAAWLGLQRGAATSVTSWALGGGVENSAVGVQETEDDDASDEEGVASRGVFAAHRGSKVWGALLVHYWQSLVAVLRPYTDDLCGSWGVVLVRCLPPPTTRARRRCPCLQCLKAPNLTPSLDRLPPQTSTLPKR